MASLRVADNGCRVYVCRISDINFLELFLEKSIDIFLEKVVL
nr:MAG TPA: hypothetical protein [Caudoviricetes sp.]